MEDKTVYVTINHLDDFGGYTMFRVGDTLTLKKDLNNCYDDEAIVAYNKHGCKCGYVANSVCTVVRGTYSAGRVYDKINDEESCKICFITEDMLIAKIDEKEEEQDHDDSTGNI